MTLCQHPLDKEYEEIVPSKKGDIIQAINKFVSVLKNNTAIHEEQLFALKFLVHLVGDPHQPFTWELKKIKEVMKHL